MTKKHLNHLETVINTSVNAIIAIDNKLHVLTFNKAAEDMFGYTIQEIQQSNNLHLIIPQKYISLHDQALSRFIKTEKSSGLMKTEIEIEAQHKNGTIIPIKMLIDYSGTGDDLIIVANIINLTEDKHQKSLILQHSRNAQMGEMLSMIAHQWRQPLSVISSTVLSIHIKQELSGLDKIFLNEQLKIISDNTQHLSQTIDDFRKFFIEEKHKVNTTLEQIIDTSLSLINPILESKNTTVLRDYKCNEELLTFPNELTQVVLNLIGNAQDILETTNTNNPTINIKTYKDDKYYYLQVHDNGGGIKHSIFDKIFDPYFTTKGSLNGTGLGLYLSKKILQEHCNGSIGVENIDNGALFTIKISK